MEDRQPEIYQVVDVLTDSGKRYINCAYHGVELYGSEYYLDISKMLEPGTVTHWMPIPELPENEKWECMTK